MSTLNIKTFPSPQRIVLSSVYSRNFKHRNGLSLLPFSCEDFEPQMWSEKLIPSDYAQSRSQWPVQWRSKAQVCGRSPAEIVGSNPTGEMSVCLL